MNKAHAFTVATLLVLGASIASAQDPAPPKPLSSTANKPGTPTAKVDLGAEFPQYPQLKGFTFIQLVTTVPPGSGMAWHSHVGAPEIVRILSGTLTDQRGDGPPKTYGPGSTLINAGGIHHQWANLGTEPVVMIGTQIHPPAKPAEQGGGQAR